MRFRACCDVVIGGVVARTGRAPADESGAAGDEVARHALSTAPNSRRRIFPRVIADSCWLAWPSVANQRVYTRTLPPGRSPWCHSGMELYDGGLRLPLVLSPKLGSFPFSIRYRGHLVHLEFTSETARVGVDLGEGEPINVDSRSG